MGDLEGDDTLLKLAVFNNAISSCKKSRSLNDMPTVLLIDYILRDDMKVEMPGDAIFIDILFDFLLTNHTINPTSVLRIVSILDKFNIESADFEGLLVLLFHIFNNSILDIIHDEPNLRINFILLYEYCREFLLSETIENIYSKIITLPRLDEHIFHNLKIIRDIWRYKALDLFIFYDMDLYRNPDKTVEDLTIYEEELEEDIPDTEQRFDKEEMTFFRGRKSQRNGNRARSESESPKNIIEV